MRFLTAGESHGKMLTAIIEGFPAGVLIDFEHIQKMLKRRQGGYGRGIRMNIEKDELEVVGGIRNGKSLGTPISLVIENKDWKNWPNVMREEIGASVEKTRVTRPRPGHADLAGTIKYNHKDIRNTLERASARETAIRVAIGALADSLLKVFKIEVHSHVVSIGNIEAEVDYRKLGEDLYQTPLYCTDDKASKKMLALIDRAKESGDSLGGVVEVVVKNLPIGLGSHVHWDRRLDANLSRAIMSIPGFKGVEIGLGFSGSSKLGSEVHDEIYHNRKQGFFHSSNNAGGLEGGMTNGEDLVIRGAMKPIPTLYKPLDSVDYFSKEKFLASVERADVCAVSASAIVAQALVSYEIAVAFLEKFAGDNILEIKNNFISYENYLRWL